MEEPEAAPRLPLFRILQDNVGEEGLSDQGGETMPTCVSEDEIMELADMLNFLCEQDLNRLAGYLNEETRSILFIAV